MAHFKLSKSLVDRESFVLNLCKDRNVLHLGCADFPYTEQSIASDAWLHAKVSKIAANCLGIDLNAETITRLREKNGIDNILEGNVEQLDKLNIGLFDVILAGEIIEHLNNPGLFLDTAKKVLALGGKLVITTTNAFCLRRFVRIPFGGESIHPDHTYYYSHTTLHTLTKRFGYVLEESHAYRIPNKQPLLPYLVERVATMISPNWGEGIIHIYSLPENSN